MQKFIPLGKQVPEEIVRKLYEIGDEEEARAYEASLVPGLAGPESFYRAPDWLNTQHQYGFIPRFEPGARRFHEVVSASNLVADRMLKGRQINIKLDYLRVHKYPKPLLDLGNKHTILFTFQASNQIPGGGETVAFNQVYKARTGQDAAVQGYPMFIGLNVGANGVTISCQTVNVGNSSDQQVVDILDSKATTSGLQLLKTAQPAIAPFVETARSLCLVMANRSKNVPVQEFMLGLDFDTGAPGARLAVGSYVVVQVERADEIEWKDWKFDSETGTIVRTNLAPGEEPYILPYNAIVFRVSQYEESFR